METRDRHLLLAAYIRPPELDTEHKDIAGYAEQIAWSALEQMKLTLHRISAKARAVEVSDWKKFATKAVDMTCYFTNGVRNGWYNDRQEFIQSGKTSPWDLAVTILVQNKEFYIEKLKEGRFL